MKLPNENWEEVEPCVYRLREYTPEQIARLTDRPTDLINAALAPRLQRPETTPMTPDKNQTDALSLAERIQKQGAGTLKQVEGEVTGCSELDAAFDEDEERMIVSALRSSTATGGREEIARVIWNSFGAGLGGPFETAKGTVAYDHCMSVADAILAIRPIGSGQITDRDLWENSCLTRAQLASWTDGDFAKHSAGIRETLTFLFDKLDAKPASGAVGMREDEDDCSCGGGDISGHDTLCPYNKPAPSEAIPSGYSEYTPITVRASSTPLVLGGDDIQTKSQKDSSRSVEGVATECSLREALQHYADTYCEGWCELSGDCAEFDHDCGGCKARSALYATRSPTDGDVA